jgi:hypothetical protein
MKAHPAQSRSTVDKITSTVALALLTLALGSQHAGAAQLFYEGFDYPVGQELADPAGSPTWENPKDQFIIAADSLEHSGIKATTGNRVNLAITGASLDGVRTANGAWTGLSSGTLYCSFLLRVVSTNGIVSAGNGTSILTIGRTSNNSQLVGVNLVNNGGIRLGVVKYPGGSTPVSSAFFTAGPGAALSANGSTSYLVIMKYEWVAGPANDIVTVWVNPDNVGVTEEDPGNRVSTSNGTDGTVTAGRLTLTRGPHLDIDEIRIGRTWNHW